MSQIEKMDKIKKFEKENRKFLENNLIKSFLKNPDNRKLFYETITNPTAENYVELDNKFKIFYTYIRFISHISSTLKFNSINYDKRIRLLNKRYSPTLDAPISNDQDGDNTFLDLVESNDDFRVADEVFSKEIITEQVTSPVLYNALQLLTKTQLQIIHLAYVEGLNDTEIAQVLNKTQQAISKTHKKALKNLLKYIENNN